MPLLVFYRLFHFHNDTLILLFQVSKPEKFGSCSASCTNDFNNKLQRILCCLQLLFCQTELNIEPLSTASCKISLYLNYDLHNCYPITV